MSSSSMAMDLYYTSERLVKTDPEAALAGFAKVITSMDTDYGFEYSDEDEIKDQYYNSKSLVETDPEGVLAGFAKVVGMEAAAENSKAKWGFKALKQTVKLYYHLGRYKEMVDACTKLQT